MQYYTTPPGHILADPPKQPPDNYYTAKTVEDVFAYCGVSAVVRSVVIAPQIVTYHVDLADIRQITAVKKCISALSVLIHSRVTQGFSSDCHFSLAVCRQERAALYFKGILATETFQGFEGHLQALFGTSSDNKILAVDIAKLPHLLIAGATGSGKSVALNSILCSLLFRHTPNTLKMIMIDTKQTELSFYSGIPHLMRDTVTDFGDALFVLGEVCRLMDERNAEMRRKGVKNITETEFPRLLVVIDELADLMIKNKEQIEPYLVRIAQLGRSAGIHLIICTQRPTVNVVTGLIKANIPARIALQCSSLRDSMTILDHKGAEQLTGRGDAILKLPSQVEEIRFQVPFISDADIRAVAKYWRYDSISEK